MDSQIFIHSPFANIKTVLPFPKYPFPDEGSHDKGEQEKPSEIKNLPQKISKVENWPELYGLDADQK